VTPMRTQNIQAGKNAPATSTSGAHDVQGASAIARTSAADPRRARCGVRSLHDCVMSRSPHIYGVGALVASAREVVAAVVGLALAASIGCAEMPWRAEQTTPPTSSQIVVDDSAGVGGVADVAAPEAPPALDRAHEYALIELIDLAQRSNPDTREAWEKARAAAARLGGAGAVYLPSLTLVVDGGAQRVSFPSPDGAFAAGGPFVSPELELAWTLLDVSRFARVSEARALVAQANFTFTRRHQEVLFAVARAYYELAASRAELDAARATLESATTVEEATQARLSVGLATQPELLLAREGRTRASFDVEAAVGAVRAAEGALAESVGVAPDPPLRVALWVQPPAPDRLASSVEDVMQATLAARPDLKALHAAVLARRADEKSASGRFAPRLSIDATAGYLWWWYDGVPGGSFTLSAPTLDARLRVDWDLFQGFEDVERVHEAQAERRASEDALAARSLRALREAWTAYFEVKTAERKVEFGDSLLTASQEAYDATLESYRHGLGTLIELLTAQRDLAAARGTAIASHAELLTAAAALTLAVGAVPPGTR
jgi:outer membrane protein